MPLLEDNQKYGWVPDLLLEGDRSRLLYWSLKMSIYMIELFLLLLFFFFLLLLGLNGACVKEQSFGLLTYLA